jgi:hypothetical protein
MNKPAKFPKVLNFSSLRLQLEAPHTCTFSRGQFPRGDAMIRTTSLAALTLALMSAAAAAQPADAPGAPPAQLSNPDTYPNQPGDQRYAPGQRQAPDPRSAQDQRSRDLFCRRDAAARTGYVTPGQAASHEQTNGTVLGTLGGAALGAVIGGAAGNAGAGAAIGAGAGLIGGTAVGADNARRAASDVERNYASAYYACMGEADGGPDDADYAYGPPPPGAYGPPPPAYYGPPPPYYYGYGPYPYPYYPYYGPSFSFGFGFGGGHFGLRGGHR